MWTVVTTIFAFVLTGLIGNRLIVQWQYNSWTRQQIFLGKEKDYIALKELISELSKEIGKRLYRMRLLSAALRQGDINRIEKRLALYEEALIGWNEKFNEFCARLTILSYFSDTKRLEDDIQKNFRQIGSELEKLVRSRRNNLEIADRQFSSIELKLQSLQVRVANFDRDMAKRVDDKRIHTYFPSSIRYDQSNLEKYSTIELIHAVFVSDVDGHSVPRAP